MLNHLVCLQFLFLAFTRCSLKQGFASTWWRKRATAGVENGSFFHPGGGSEAVTALRGVNSPCKGYRGGTERL